MEKAIEIENFATYLNYKDSGAAWLGKVPEHWLISKVKFQTNYKKGKNPTSISLTPTEYIYLSMDFLRGKHQKIQYVKNKKDLVEIADDDILLLWDGANAGEFLNGKKGILSSTMAVIRIKSSNVGFCKYYFNVIETQLRESTIGMGIPHVNGSEFANLSFLVPPLTEQIDIANFLDHKTTLINQAISQKAKQIELLKEHRQILIYKAITNGLKHEVALKCSDIDWIDKIPEHWKIVINRSLFEERNEPGNPSLPILSVSIHTAVSSEELSEENNIRGKIRIEDKTSYKSVKVNDIAYNMMRAWQGAIGNVSTQGMVSPAYVVAKPIGQINSEFFEFQYRTQAFIQQMDRFSKGITDFRKRLYWSEFKQLKTILPPIDEQLEIVDFIKKSTNKIAIAIICKEKEIASLKEYKATLINSTVTGKIKVR